MDELDLFLARAARALVKHNESDLATKLLSCRLIYEPTVDYDLQCLSVGILGNRDMYEHLWNKGTVNPGYAIIGLRTKYTILSELGALAAAFVDACVGLADSCPVQFYPQYGSSDRSATAQTELYMYVFGDDPIGEQIQVLDVGSHSAPTRQLIVSPVPALPVTDIARDGKLCFIIMPFASQFRLVYDNAIMRAVTESEMICRRGDDISQPGAILSQIWQSLLQARLVIADLSGGNGNVLYELGLASVLGHEAILLTQDISDVPFDLRHQRTILYRRDDEGLDVLRASLTAAIQSSLAVKR